MMLLSSLCILLVRRVHRVAAVQDSVTVVMICCGLRCLLFCSLFWLQHVRTCKCMWLFFAYVLQNSYRAFSVVLLCIWIKKKSMTAKELLPLNPQPSLAPGNRVVYFLPFCMTSRGLPHWAVNERSSSGRVWLKGGQVYS